MSEPAETRTIVEPVNEPDGIRLEPDENGSMCLIRRPEGTFLVTRDQAEADA